MTVAPPVLAVVGFVNMGKSSLVATLTETDSVAIDATGGTTTVCQRFACQVDGETIFELIDTPGFQSARRALRWLEDWLDDREEESATGPDAIRAFLKDNAGSELFVNECRLLEPIMAGAGILYLVDASIPYKAKYEAEMRILAMTGQVRMGVINLHGAAEHRQVWEQALQVNFAKVISLDVAHAEPQQRRQVLERFADIADDWRQAFERAKALLDDEHVKRRARVAKEIRQLLRFCLTHHLQRPLPEGADKGELTEQLREDMKAALSKAEQASRRSVELIMGFEHLKRQEAGLTVVDDDLFSKEVWRVLGMSRRHLLTVSTASGAGAGALIDLGVGGLSVGTGALIGGAAGLLSGLMAIGSNFSVKVLGQDVLDNGAQLQVHAPQHLKWATVVLDRALLHYQLVAKRAHAKREALEMTSASLIDHMGKEVHQQLARLVSKTASSEGHLDDSVEQDWQAWCVGVLTRVEQGQG